MRKNLVHKKKKLWLLILGLILGVFLVGFVVYIAFGVFSLRGIPQSYIDANVPEVSVFDDYLERDLTSYFYEKLGEDVTVEFSLLRDTPTQSGIADPKYYVWVAVTYPSGKTVRGAVRVAAAEKEYFNVMDFVSLSDIKSDSESACEIFPQDVCQKIQELAIE